MSLHTIAIFRFDRLEKLINDRYRHPRNWVEEFRMDLPRALRSNDGVQTQ